MSKGPVSPLSPSKPRRATLTNPIRGSNNWIQAMAESNDGIVIGTRMRLAIQARPGTAVRSSSQDCESHPRTDDDSIVAFCHCLDPIVGSPYRIGQRRSARRAGTEWETGPLDIYSLGGMCFVQGLRLVPSAYLMIAASFRAMDPSLEDQSAMAGRNVAQTTLKVTLPIVRPALLAALIYYVIVVIESFDIPGLLGFTARIRVLSTAIYWATHSEVGLPDYGLASALGTIVLVLALFLMWIYHRLTAHQERFATITGKGYRPRQINLSKWKLPALLFCLVYVSIAVLLPFVMLLWTSVQPFYAS